MALNLLLLAGVLGAPGDTDLPPAPDFGALIPQTTANLPASERWKYEPTMDEAKSLARYMTRAWGRIKTRDQLNEQAFNLLTVTQQFDSALMSLNPKPTVTEAVARVRAYEVVLALAQNQVRLDPQLRDDFQFNAQLFRFRKQIQEQYGALFRRAM